METELAPFKDWAKSSSSSLLDHPHNAGRHNLKVFYPFRYKNLAAEYLESGPIERIPSNGGDFLGINLGVVLFNLTR